MPATNLTFKNLQDRVLSFGYGETARTNVKEWINMAYSDVMSRRRWSWSQDTQTVVTVAGTPTVTLASLTDPPLFWGRLYPTTSNLREPTYLDPMRYNDGLTRQSPSLTRGIPEYYTIFDQTVTFYPTPNGVYTFTLYYWKGAAEMVNDADQPLIPAQWRNVLVYGALRFAAERDRNDNSLARRTAEYEKNIAHMIGAENLLQAETGLRVEMPEYYYGRYDR
jgi:hypothetical protein